MDEFGFALAVFVVGSLMSSLNSVFNLWNKKSEPIAWRKSYD